MNLLRLALLILIIFGICYFAAPYIFPGRFSQPGNNYREVKIGGSVFKLEIADDEEEWLRGLSGRDSIQENKGMIFLFKDAGNHGVWTKDMRFPMDIVWLKDKKVVDIAESVEPVIDTASQIYGQDLTSDAVIELFGGTVKKIGLQIGDRLAY